MYKKRSFYLVILILCLLVSSCKDTTASNGKDGKDGASIVWKGAYSSADQIENPEYLWVYYNTEDGCSYIYDGEKWVLFAAGNKQYGTLDGSEVFIVKYQTDNGTDIEPFYCTYGYKITSAKLPEITKDHYSFDGWYDGETKVSENYKITRNTTLTAKWIINKCKITYVCDDNTITVPETVFVDYGTVLDSSYFPIIDKNDLKIGWYNSEKIIKSNYKVLSDTVFIGKVLPIIEWGKLYRHDYYSNGIYVELYSDYNLNDNNNIEIDFYLYDRSRKNYTSYKIENPSDLGESDNNYVYIFEIDRNMLTEDPTVSNTYYILFTMLVDNTRYIIKLIENANEPIIFNGEVNDDFIEEYGLQHNFFYY